MTDKQKIPPTYLNEVCLQKALEKACNTSNVKLKDYEIKLANLSGVNYCSNIYRVNGNYEILSTGPEESNLKEDNDKNQLEKKFNFIIKDMFMEMVEDGTNESNIFENILPEFFNILKEVDSIESNTETSNKLAASCYLTESTEDYEFYIFEDLNTLGYSLGNRHEGLTAKQAKLVMEKIAKFHAASMVYIERFPKNIAALYTTQFAKSPCDAIGNAIRENGTYCAMEIFKTLDQEMILKIQKIATQFTEKAKRIVDPKENSFNVLNHADLWINNILLQEQDVVFVDFQNSFWGNPAFDLNYILYTSLSLETLQTERYQLLNHYYKILKLTLETLEYKKIPTWSDLSKEMRRCALIGYYCVLCERPFGYMSDEISKSFTSESFLDTKVMRSLILENPKVYKLIWYALLHFEEIGLFSNE